MLLQSKTVQQLTLDRLRELSFAFQAHRSQTRAFLQDALHVLPIVFALLFASLRGIKVGIARNADDVGVLDLVHGEDLHGVHLDEMLQQQELEAAPRQFHDAFALARQGDDAQRDPGSP